MAALSLAGEGSRVRAELSEGCAFEGLIQYSLSPRKRQALDFDRGRAEDPRGVRGLTDSQAALGGNVQVGSGSPVQAHGLEREGVPSFDERADVSE